MANIYNYLRNVYQKVKKELLNNPAVTLITLLFLTLPLHHTLNSVCTILFIAYSFWTFRNNRLVINKTLLLPVLLCLLMGFSIFWSIDTGKSIDAFTKEIPLLLIPICFMILPFSKNDIQKILYNYSLVFFIFTVFYLLRAVVKFLIYKDTNVFFYHELVSLDLNAIHVSFYCAIAFFIFLIKPQKNILDRIAIPTLLLFIFLLSSKNIIIVFLFLLIIYGIFYASANKSTLFKSLVFIGFIAICLISFSKIQERFQAEVLVENNQPYFTNGVHTVTIHEALTNEKFSPNDFFPGTAFRIYQARLFVDFLKEEPIFWKGFGLNASTSKMKEKAIQYDVFQGSKSMLGYQKKNFHNQYIQNFAELGVFGFIILILMLVITLRNAIKTKDFIHFSFAVLTISLFLTESFLWRQRGVLFFTLFYCLFNTTVCKSATTKIE